MWEKYLTFSTLSNTGKLAEFFFFSFFIITIIATFKYSKTPIFFIVHLPFFAS